ncbi:MAG: non-canonical purine NTP pyrophosphatase [Candidatus Berkelbacteria bacterium]|nr:non-canonical purine NTP pyrophosphatase [Candidatus Berkelbacteria bacterium]
MKKITFISGNKNKVERVREYLRGIEVSHKDLEINEIQSLDLEKVVEHKARQAFEIVKSPVLVEDVSLVYSAFGNLPGPLIKWFLAELGNAGLCRILNHYTKDKNREAVAEVSFGFFDGKNFKSFGAQVNGRIAPYPKGENGFGWDPIFIPEGSDKTLGETGSGEKEKLFRAKALQDFARFYLDKS